MRPMKKRPPDIRATIESLGGGTIVADEMNKLIPKDERRVDREAVYKWADANKVPHYRRLPFAKLVIKEGLPLPSQLAELAPIARAQ